jgi:uncharacterized membrane protein YesL
MAELPLNRQSYVRQTFRRLWEELPQMLLASFVFSLGWLPVFSFFILNLPFLAVLVGAFILAPAWALVLAHEVRLLEGRAASLGTLAQDLRRYGRRSLKLGLLAAFPLVTALLTLPSLAAPEVPAVVWLGLAADALGLLLLLTLYLYAFPLLILHDLEVGAALYNSLILASRYLMNTLGLLSLGGLFSLAVLYLNSGLLFILPAIWGMFIVNNCRLIIMLEEE